MKETLNNKMDNREWRIVYIAMLTLINSFFAFCVYALITTTN